jgi:hypothetical protein
MSLVIIDFTIIDPALESELLGVGGMFTAAD